MKIVKVMVGKGQSIEKENGSWERVNYELTAETEFKGDEEAIKNELTSILDAWLNNKPVDIKTPGRVDRKTPVQEAKNVWKNYNKQPCKPREAGWAFRNDVALPIQYLLDNHQDGVWHELENMEYKTSGDGFTLVNKRPLKETK